MTSPLEPKPGFDWTKVRWTGPLALVDDTCSYCGSAIPEDSAYVPLRLWIANEHTKQAHGAAVFCDACMATWWGMRTVDVDDSWPDHLP